MCGLVMGAVEIIIDGDDDDKFGMRVTVGSCAFWCSVVLFRVFS